MAEQLTAVAGEFGSYLNGLLSRLDQNAGWCGVFWHRDPHGMRACREGHEVPPWDVVDALLRDLAATYGSVPALAERERARALHVAALTAYDARPGAHDTLTRRLRATLRERGDADEREAALTQRLTEARTEAEADALRIDLAWTRDTRHRATARCAELRDRLSRLSRPKPSAARVPGQGVPGRTSRAGTSGFVPDGPAGAAAAASGQAGSDDAPYGAPSALAPDSPAGAAEQAASIHTPYAGTSAFAPDSRAGAAARAVEQAASDLVSDGPDGAAAAASGQAGSGHAPYGAPSAFAPDGLAGVAARAAEQAAFGRASYGAGSGFESDSPAEGAARASVQAESSRTPYASTLAPGGSAEDHSAAEAPSKPRKRRRGSARFAGLDDEAPAPLVLPGAAPVTPDLRGARFAGAEAEEVPGPAAPVPHPDDHRAVAQAVGHLAALRAAGRSGEAYSLLAEAARWPAVRLPLLAIALTHADWTTLRWEAAALPPEQLVTRATALTAAGHSEEAHRLLREGAARPPEETGAAVARLHEEGRTRDARTLLDACLRTRTPEDAARIATPDPDRLTPLLLEAAAHLSEDRHRALLHALRAAGITP
ncbi:hypothetical protein ABTZ78_11130 [Streptomyces bauhiniae]|uniref:hypothetical protein n=1 Tax=Streptomyces bauhiniae TaxID=2340725 RepID=UPI0033345283